MYLEFSVDIQGQIDNTSTHKSDFLSKNRVVDTHGFVLAGKRC